MKQKINKIIIFIFIIFVTVSVKASSCDILEDDLKVTLNKNIFVPIKVIAPVLLLVFTSIDFAKAIFVNNDKDGVQKAKSNFAKRSVATLVVFFAPEIIKLILGLADNGDLTACLGNWG